MVHHKVSIKVIIIIVVIVIITEEHGLGSPQPAPDGVGPWW